jgi:hypothetical protein
MAEIDGELLGFRRDMHHRFLLGGGATHAVRVERACGTAGYAYISAEGHVGPLAVTRDADAKAVVTTVLRCALESEPSQVSMIVPGRADGVMQAVLALGLRLEEPYVLMASRPFGNWCNYLVRAPGFLYPSTSEGVTLMAATTVPQRGHRARCRRPADVSAREQQHNGRIESSATKKIRGRGKPRPPRQCDGRRNC